MRAGTGSGSFPHDNQNHFTEARKRLIVRALGITLVVALIALAASQQVTSSPNTAASKDRSNQIQLDVVHNSTKPTHSSVNIENKSDVNNSTNDNSATSNNSSSSVNVTVNGRSINVPENGATQQTITTPGSTTSVNISNNTDSSGSSYSSSFSAVNQNGFSSSESFQSDTSQEFGSSP